MEPSDRACLLDADLARMPMLELSLIKAHLRLEDDFVAEDALLETYGRAAWNLAQNRTGRFFISGTKLPEGCAKNSILLEDDLRLALLLLVAHWYEHREAASAAPVKSLPLAVDALLNPYRWIKLL